MNEPQAVQQPVQQPVQQVEGSPPATTPAGGGVIPTEDRIDTIDKLLAQFSSVQPQGAGSPDEELPAPVDRQALQVEYLMEKEEVAAAFPDLSKEQQSKLVFAAMRHRRGMLTTSELLSEQKKALAKQDEVQEQEQAVKKAAVQSEGPGESTPTEADTTRPKTLAEARRAARRLIFERS